MLQRILIADDDELQSEVLWAALQARGHRVEVVSDGLEAMDRLRTGHYDLGLLDYRMPQLSGLAVVRMLRDYFSDDECPRLIAFTAAADELGARNLPSEGKWFHAVVSKQLGLPALISVIDANLAAVAEARAAAKAALHRQPIATEPGQAETDEPKEGTRSKRVLIAENHELLSEILRDALAARGYRVEVVSDGLQAVHRLYTGNYDLGLLDYRMPQISGLAVARLLRDFFPDDKCPRLIAFTAATDELNSKNLPSDGKWFHAVVSKQDGLPALISVIDRELSRAGQGLGQSTLRPMM